MIKKTSKMHFRYDGENMSLVDIYKKNKKRRGRSRYLLSIEVEVIKDGEIIPAKVVYVRNKNKRSDYLCLISTDVSLTKMKSLSNMASAGTSRCFSKYARVILDLEKSVTPYPLMQ